MDSSSFLKYKSTKHAAVRTQEYVFNQLFPYIGNKRKLLPLIWEAMLRCHSERSEESNNGLRFFANAQNDKKTKAPIISTRIYLTFIPPN